MKNIWTMFIGLASVLDGIIMLGSLGFFGGRCRQQASLKMAQIYWAAKQD